MKTKQLFSNGTEYEIWAANNCNVCILSCQHNGQGDECISPRCEIEQSIFNGMGGIDTTEQDYTNVHGGVGGHCTRLVHLSPSKRTISDSDKQAVRNYWMVS